MHTAKEGASFLEATTMSPLELHPLLRTRLFCDLSAPRHTAPFAEGER